MNECFLVVQALKLVVKSAENFNSFHPALYCVCVGHFGVHSVFQKLLTHSLQAIMIGLHGWPMSSSYNDRTAWVAHVKTLHVQTVQWGRQMLLTFTRQ